MKPMQEKIKYTVFIRKAPDGFYIASCPLIPEAKAQGETCEECLANIKEVRFVWNSVKNAARKYQRKP